jgi:hypothetical protein
MSTELDKIKDNTLQEIEKEAIPQANPLDRFGFKEDAIEEVFKENELLEIIRRDKRVCACGHPIKKHEDLGTAGWICKPGRHKCKCSIPRAVIAVWDTRYFMRKSSGNGGRHALALGIKACMNANPAKNNLIEWLVPNNCQQCEAENVKLFPVSMTDQGVIMQESAYISKLLCESCAYDQPTELRNVSAPRPELNQ